MTSTVQTLLIPISPLTLKRIALGESYIEIQQQYQECLGKRQDTDILRTSYEQVCILKKQMSEVDSRIAQLNSMYLHQFRPGAIAEQLTYLASDSYGQIDINRIIACYPPIGPTKRMMDFEEYLLQVFVQLIGQSAEFACHLLLELENMNNLAAAGALVQAFQSCGYNEVPFRPPRVFRDVMNGQLEFLQRTPRNSIPSLYPLLMDVKEIYKNYMVGTDRQYKPVLSEYGTKKMLELKYEYQERQQSCNIQPNPDVLHLILTQFYIEKAASNQHIFWVGMCHREEEALTAPKQVIADEPVQKISDIEALNPVTATERDEVGATLIESASQQDSILKARLAALGFNK